MYSDKKNVLVMLQGNINRMSVTDDIKELEKMKFYAEARITELYHLKLDELDFYFSLDINDKEV